MSNVFMKSSIKSYYIINSWKSVDDHFWNLAAEVSKVSLFQVAEAPSNKYDSPIPIWGFIRGF